MKQEVLPPIDETIGAGAMPPPLPPGRSVSILRKRIRKFRTLRRGYYSFLVLAVAYAVSFILPVLINDRALVVRYHGQYYFPMVTYYPASDFGQAAIGEPNYRELKRQLAQAQAGDWVLMPPYPYSATESLLDLPAHALDGTQAPNVIVELGEAGQDGLHELAFGVGVDRLRDRDDLDVVLAEHRLEVEVIRNIPGEAINLPDQEHLNLPLALAAVVNQLQ